MGLCKSPSQVFRQRTGQRYCLISLNKSFAKCIQVVTQESKTWDEHPACQSPGSCKIASRNHTQRSQLFRNFKSKNSQPMPIELNSFSANRIAYRVLLTFAAIAIIDGQLVTAQQDSRPTMHPSEIQFRRQAVRRMVFDPSQTIPLSTLDPSKVVSFDLMHPELSQAKETAKCSIDGGTLTVASTNEAAESFRWFGSFNPFATYEVTIGSFIGTGSSGLSFHDSVEANSLSTEVMFADGKPVALTWRVVHDSVEVDQVRWEWPAELDDLSEPFVLRRRCQPWV